MFRLGVLGRNRRFSTRIMEKFNGNHDYEGCIEALNSLQSNANYIKRKSGAGPHGNDQLVQVRKYLKRSGLPLERLDQLSVIHVAGTKGKGTTCAFTERILRGHGYTTGFFSSPHLLEVRERIRINGEPISRTEFASYFWSIYAALDKDKGDENDMPLYFRFLTVMAYNIFVDKKVDVAVIEVGIGGEYDCTNVVRKTHVCGITSLGIDHVSLLGSTVEQIAWHKAGIMKENALAFTVPQERSALQVLKDRSVERHCQLQIVDNCDFKLPKSVGPSDVLRLNASLAVAMCDAWLNLRLENRGISRKVTEKALSECRWAGRFDVRQKDNIRYYLDGAHTLESITICSNWFKSVTKSSPRKKGLMFNVTGERTAEALLQQLKRCDFDAVLFVTNSTGKSENSDNITFKSTDELFRRCEANKATWLKISAGPDTICEAFRTVLEGVEFLRNQGVYDLLVTGSIHLIGSVLSTIEPGLNPAT